ncbi:radical SAM protein [Denitratimonas sp. CY0512]|uniref:radical SAM protein n=1 Tax=Denitratimonas sp. CY0512 TaxID=3131940 RepID=UPI0030B1462B
MSTEQTFPNGYHPSTIASAFDNSTLELIILPTEKCNFRCTYCYEDFKIGKMSAEVVSGIKNLIRNRITSLKRLHLSWFGGEPLLAKSILFDISEFAAKLSRDNKVSFNGGLTTNGYLLDKETLDRLVKCGQNHFQITLDGDVDIHDTRRLRADGSGTFDVIWNNLMVMKSSSHHISVTIRVHIASDNLDSLGRLVPRLNGSFGDDGRFDIHFHRLSDLGGSASGNIPTLNYSDYSKAMLRLKGESRVLADSELDKTKRREICYAARSNSIMVRSDGRLGKCTVALDDPRNTIGHINPDGTVDIDNDLLRLWLEGFTDFDVSALSCPLTAINRAARRQIPIVLNASMS